MCTGPLKVRVVCPGRKPSLVGAWELDSKRGTALISVTNRHSLADSQKISLPSSAWQVSWGGTPQRWPEVQGGNRGVGWKARPCPAASSHPGGLAQAPLPPALPKRPASQPLGPRQG